ncbi:MAG: hypothetical protein RII27_10265 [Alphaproteobacteria bacterium]
MAWPRADIPFDRDDSGRFLPWLVALMVFLAALALAVSLTVSVVASQWRAGAAGTLPLQVPAEPTANACYSDSGASGGSAAALAEAVLRTLRQTPGIASARNFTPAEVSALLTPWLGQGADLTLLPVPLLFDARTTPGARVDLEALRASLSTIAPGVSVDDHGRWLADLLRFARTIQISALAVVAAVAAAAVLAVSFAVRAGLAVHRPVIALLHHMGATDTYVVRQFALHALKLGLKGAALGGALSVVTLMAVAVAAGMADRDLPASLFGFGHVLALLTVPMVAVVIAVVTARTTVQRALRRLP